MQFFSSPPWRKAAMRRDCSSCFPPSISGLNAQLHCQIRARESNFPQSSPYHVADRNTARRQRVHDAKPGRSAHDTCKAGADNGDIGGVGSDTVFLGAGSEILNQATYKAGRKISVSTVATASPPMIANAMGPQNTVGAIGIIPRVAAEAVSRIGRVRWIAAITMASQGWCPAAISVPIWSMRMTELRAIM